jgi:hypothetical protein
VRRFPCMSGCPTPWKGRPLSLHSSMLRPW